jgi:hypothetical protein
MKHCSSCWNCITDNKALLMGVYIKKCRLVGHNILHPFFSGFKCGRYRRAENAD